MKNIELLLYEHYEKKQKIVHLESSLKEIEGTIKKLKQDIKNSNVEMESTLKSIDYSKERVSSNIISQIEIELTKAHDRIVQDLKDAIINKNQHIELIRKYESETSILEKIIDELSEKEKVIIKLKYSKDLPINEIANTINFSRTTIYKEKKRILDKIKTNYPTPILENIS